MFVIVYDFSAARETFRELPLTMLGTGVENVLEGLPISLHCFYSVIKLFCQLIMEYQSF